MEENNNTTNNKNNVFKYLLIGFLIIFIVSGIFMAMTNKKPTNIEKVTTNIAIPTQVPIKRGFINLKNNLISNNVDSQVELSLIVDSDSEKITALDTIISYDPTSFDFVSATPNDSNYKIYSYKKDQRLTLTIININQNSSPPIFSEKTIANIIFKPKIKGRFIFEVLSSFGQEITKFVNDKTEILYPSNNKINVIIN